MNGPVPSRTHGRVAGLVVLGAAVLVCAPVLLRRGFVLIGDMTFVPEQPWKDAWLGLDGSAPRAVPADALVSVLTQAVPGDLLQKAVLLGALLLAGAGMFRLVSRGLGTSSQGAALAAAVLYLWNPYVHERLAIGHWGLLLGYAALPWIVLAALSVRRGDPGAIARLTLAVVPAAFGSPTGGLLAGLVVLVVVGGPGAVALRRTAVALAVVVLLDLPWLVPGLVGAETGSDPAGVDAFAARSDTPLGLWGSLLTLGGIWKQSIVAGEREAWLLVLIALAVSLGSLLALVRQRRVPDTTGVGAGRMLFLGTVGLVLAGLPATGIGGDAVAELVEHVAGAGVLRDSQKWIALLALGVCAGFGLLIAAGAEGLRARGLAVGWLPVGAVLLPLVLLPSMAWGLAGKLEPVRYPAEWSQVRAILDDRPAGERRTVVLPFSAYQRLPWNDARAALDPAIRFFPGQVVTNDELVLSADRSVDGDSAAAALIGDAVRRGAPLEPVLAEVGVRFVLVERTAAGADGVELPAGAVLHQGAELVLVDTGNRAVLTAGEHRAAVVVGDLIAGSTVLGAAGFLALRRIRRINPEIG